MGNNIKTIEHSFSNHGQNTQQTDKTKSRQLFSVNNYTENLSNNIRELRTLLQQGYGNKCNNLQISWHTSPLGESQITLGYKEQSHENALNLHNLLVEHDLKDKDTTFDPQQTSCSISTDECTKLCNSLLSKLERNNLGISGHSKATHSKSSTVNLEELFKSISDDNKTSKLIDSMHNNSGMIDSPKKSS